MDERTVPQICFWVALGQSWMDHLGLRAIPNEVGGAGSATAVLTTELVEQVGLVELINRLNGLRLPMLAAECLEIE